MFRKIWEWFCLSMGVSAYEEQSDRSQRIRAMQERARQERVIREHQGEHSDEDEDAAEAPSADGD